MGNITLVPPVAATPAVAGTFSTAFTTIQTAINGNIDNVNINAAAAIAQSKIAFDAWAAYTPAWTSSGTAPAVGNGTLVGKYAQVGKTVIGRVVLTMGSTTTFGTGTYSFSLPVTANASETGTVGNILIFDSSAGSSYVFASIVASTTTMNGYSLASPAGVLTNVVPVTFAVSDSIGLHFTYEAA